MNTLTLAPAASPMTTSATLPADVAQATPAADSATGGFSAAALSASRPRPARRPLPATVAEARRALADCEREAARKAEGVRAAQAALAHAEAAELADKGGRSLPAIIRGMDVAARSAVEALLVEAASERQRPAMQAWFASLSSRDGNAASA